MISKSLSIITIILQLLIFPNDALALEGAGPDDVYGGPSQNRNICTPYHFIPEDRLTLSYNWVGASSYSYYWTQGNNISQLVTSDGVYHLGSARQANQLACIYPRGSGFGMIRSQCIFESAIGEFNAREPKDTVFARYLGGHQRAGRIPTDLGYREDLMPSSDL